MKMSTVRLVAEAVWRMHARMTWMVAEMARKAGDERMSEDYAALADLAVEAGKQAADGYEVWRKPAESGRAVSAATVTPGPSRWVPSVELRRRAVDCGVRPECADRCRYGHPCPFNPTVGTEARRIDALLPQYCGSAKTHAPHRECPGLDDNGYVPGTFYCRGCSKNGHLFTSDCLLHWAPKCEAHRANQFSDICADGGCPHCFGGDDLCGPRCGRRSG